MRVDLPQRTDDLRKKAAHRTPVCAVQDRLSPTFGHVPPSATIQAARTRTRVQWTVVCSVSHRRVSRTKVSAVPAQGRCSSACSPILDQSS